MRKPTILATCMLAGVLAAAGLGVGMNVGAAGALMGPPIVCHPMLIGEGKSLPWGAGAFDSKKGYYSAPRLVSDVAEILKTEPSVLVRMETLRRAAVYLRDEGSETERRAVAWEILGRIMDEALEQQAAGKEVAQPWFDAGFLIAAYDQAGVDLNFKAGVKDGIKGFAFVNRSLEIAWKTKDAPVGEMEYGAALMTLPAMRSNGRSEAQKLHDQEEYDTHIRQAAQVAKPGSLLESNLAAHLANWGTTLEKVRAQAKTHEARDVSARK